MSWTKEQRPWKFFVEVQTSHSDAMIDDGGGICGPPVTYRTYWGGGRTQKEAITNMRRKFETVIRQFEKMWEETKNTDYETF